MSSMLSYLEDVKLAATNQIELIWKELNAIDNLQTELNALVQQTKDGYQRAQAFADSEDPDDIMLGTGIYWETYFGTDKEAFHANDELLKLKDSYDNHRFSIAAISASLLQMAKQGISIVHGGLNDCPDGRNVGSQKLKTIIWQGRNQAIHFEEGNFRQPVIDCFNILNADFDNKFGDYTTRSMGFEVIDILSWRTFELFAKDLMSIG